jgi:hypothetical protein
LAKLVNLDAMIKREDLDVTDKDAALIQVSGSIKAADLEQSSTTFNILRKPDFQRETANWTAEKIADLIENFRDGDLIPSVVIWRSNKSGKLFVIDGAHRLSALIAWVNEDYGDQTISNKFFGQIEEPQKKIARETKKLIESRIGSYSNFKKYVQEPDGAPDEKTLLRARTMAAVGITIQDVRGDVANAERSFLKINQSATPIHPTELVMIQARKKPNALAARALLRAGRGHAYWGEFEDNVKRNIILLANDIYENLFKPLLDSPIRTLELPAAGQALTPDSLDLVFTLVNHLNHAVNVSTKKNPGRWKYKLPSGEETDLPDDKDGSLTLIFMDSVKDSTTKVFGSAKGSLALYTSIYCYGATGRFQPTAFFAAIEFVKYLETHRAFDKFTISRAKMEDFLIEYRHFINQIVGSYGSQLKGLPALLKMYRIIFEHIGNVDKDTVVKLIKADPELSFVTEISDEDRQYGRNFSRETSSAIFLRRAISKAMTCEICGARIHTGTITLDHRDRKEDGGLGSPENGQIAHPYCNHGFKEKMAYLAKRGN